MSMTYDDPITFSGAPLNRVSEHRKDGDWLADRMMDRDSRFMPLSRLRAFIDVSAEPEIAWCSPLEVLDLLEENRPLLLGTRDGIAHFAIEADPRRAPRDAVWPDKGKFIDVRSIAPALPVGKRRSWRRPAPCWTGTSGTGSVPSAARRRKCVKPVTCAPAPMTVARRSISRAPTR